MVAGRTESVAMTVQDAVKLRTLARAQAIECGLKEPLVAGEPEVIMYPRFGFGYSVYVSEQEGMKRSGRARFSDEFQPTYWSIDGKGAI